MPLLKVLDVIWIHDGCIRPPGPKMIVCVEPDLGYFFRINTDGKWQTPVKLRVADHPFLDHDSHLECGIPLELDDYIIQQALDRRPVIGRIARAVVPAIRTAVEGAQTLSTRDKVAIMKALS